MPENLDNHSLENLKSTSYWDKGYLYTMLEPEHTGPKCIHVMLEGRY